MAIMIPWLTNTILDYRGNLKAAVQAQRRVERVYLCRPDGAAGECHQSIDVPGLEPVNPATSPLEDYLCINYSMITKYLAHEK